MNRRAGTELNQCLAPVILSDSSQNISLIIKVKRQP